MDDPDKNRYDSFTLYGKERDLGIKSMEVPETTTIGRNVNIHPSAQIGNYVVLGDQVTVEAGCTIGDYSRVGSFSVIHRNCTIGKFCSIGIRASIGSEGYGYSQDQKYQHHFIPQVGNVEIKDHCIIGSHCSIDRAAYTSTSIDSFTYLGARSHLAHNLKIGKNNKVGINFVVAGSTSIGDNNILGAKTSMAGHKNIGSNITFDKKALVNNHIDTKGSFLGQPIVEKSRFKIAIDLKSKLYLFFEKIREL